MVKKEKIKRIIHHEVHEGNEEKDKKMKNRQQLNYLQHQYIYCIYYKLLCLQYLQNLSSVFCHPSSGITGNTTNKNTEHGNYTYGYDNLDRLTTADCPTLSDETFTYDALGNRKTDSNTGVVEWLYNQNNQLLNSVNNQYTYDANGSRIEKKDGSGQLLKQYIYNNEDRLTEIKDSNGETIATYYYDPFGRRLSKTITNPDLSKTTTYFHYSDEGYSAEKTDGQIISYLFSPQNTWSANPILKRENNTYYYYQNDYLGTPNILHDKQGQVVNAREMKAFGEWVNSINSIDNKFAFAGQYKDNEKESYYNHYRSYNFKNGRYQESDPIGLIGGINTYVYSANSPLTQIDNHGLFCVWYTDEGDWVESNRSKPYYNLINIIFTDIFGNGNCWWSKNVDITERRTVTSKKLCFTCIDIPSKYCSGKPGRDCTFRWVYGDSTREKRTRRENEIFPTTAFGVYDYGKLLWGFCSDPRKNWENMFFRG